MAAAHSLCIGVGNPYRRDDGAGPAVVEALHDEAGAALRGATASGEGAGLIELLRGEEQVMLFDAVSSAEAPGTIHRFDAARESIPRGLFAYSSHAFSVAEAIELARVLGELPPRLTLYGIVGADFSAGKGLSAAVAEAVRSVAREVAAQLKAESC